MVEPQTVPAVMHCGSREAEQGQQFSLVFGGLYFFFRGGQGFSRLAPGWRFKERRLGWFGRLGAGAANLDAIMLVVEDNVRRAVADTSRGFGFVIVVVDLKFGKI